MTADTLEMERRLQELGGRLEPFDPEALTAALTPVAAAALLTFCLLYTPCVAAVAAIKRELGGKWAAGVVLAQCAVAWIAAFVVYQAGMLVF